MNDLSHLKPFIFDFITYYYEELENRTGGSLHIVLDDGNVEHSNIFYCREYALKNEDSFGVFLCDILRLFSEKELEDMYSTSWGARRI